MSLALLCGYALADVAVYVSPSGSDSAAGTLKAPLQSLAAAQAKVRGLLAQGLREPVKVVLRGGTYHLSGPLVFTPQDSGAAACPVTWTAFSGERAVLSGGRPIRSFKHEGKLWTVQLPEIRSGQWSFSSLFVNGKRRQRARIPNAGFFRIAGTFFADRDPKTQDDARARTAFRFTPGDLQRWERLDDAMVVVYHSWETSLHRIKSLDTQQNVVEFTGPAAWHFSYFGPQRRYFVENVYEGLDQPGEWYLNRETGVLSYYPLAGETPETTEVLAPVTTELLRIVGEPAAGLPVSNLNLRNLVFQHADFRLEEKGHSDPQAVCSLPAAVMITGARDCEITGCEIGHVGMYGLWLRRGCHNVKLVQNHLYDLGAGGIRVGETVMANQPHDLCGGHTVDNNYIHDYGEVYAAGVGVYVGQSSDNRITHNEIHDGYYSGMSIGWNWGVSQTQAHRNLIADNHIHHVMKQMLSDGAGIYTLGTSPGTVIRHNLIHDVFSYESPLIAWGIYLDAHSNQITVEDNLCHDNTNGGLMMHNGGFGHVIRNNIFARSADQLIWRAKPVQPPSPVFQRNICYVTQGDLFLYDAEPDETPGWDSNLYWRTDGGELSFMQDTFAEWQERGMDRHSLIVDPQFVDPAKNDFRLQSTSPAITKLGFKPLTFDSCGLYGDPVWTRLPRLVKFPPTVLPAPSSQRKPVKIAEDFEQVPVESEAPHAVTSVGPIGGGRITVSDERAASGKHSLKFTDAPGLKNEWDPHLFYQPSHNSGTARLRFKLWAGPGAVPWIEWRTPGYPYAVGPSLKVDAQGQLIANGKTLATLPREHWIAFEITCPLGKDATGEYDLTMRVAEQAPQEFKGLASDPKFRRVGWIGFISLATERTEFFVDDVYLEVAK